MRWVSRPDSRLKRYTDLRRRWDLDTHRSKVKREKWEQNTLWKSSTNPRIGGILPMHAHLEQQPPTIIGQKKHTKPIKQISPHSGSYHTSRTSQGRNQNTCPTYKHLTTLLQVRERLPKRQTKTEPTAGKNISKSTTKRPRQATTKPMPITQIRIHATRTSGPPVGGRSIGLHTNPCEANNIGRAHWYIHTKCKSDTRQTKKGGSRKPKK